MGDMVALAVATSPNRTQTEATEPALYRRLLIPLDGSACAEQVLPYATHLAAHRGAELVLLRVTPPRAPSSPIPSPLRSRSRPCVWMPRPSPRQNVRKPLTI